MFPHSRGRRHEGPPIAVAERLAATQFGLITRRQLFEVGVTRRQIDGRLASDRWELWKLGIYSVVAMPPSKHRDLMGACLMCGPDAAVSHRSAAAIHSLPGGDDQLIEITANRQTKRPGVIVHRRAVPRHCFRSLEGLPVTSVDLTLLDLGEVLPTRRVEEAVDAALARRLTTTDRLRAHLERYGGSGRGGSGALRSILDLSDGSQPPPESVLETRFVQFLRRYGLPQPDRQVPIREAGRFVGRVDFFFEPAKVIVEADSFRHHVARNDWERDRIRRNELTLLGWKVLHVTWKQLHDAPRETAARLRRALGLTLL